MHWQYTADDVARFWAKVDRSDDCWLWTGARTKAGYGSLRLNGRVVYAHQVAWVLANGPIPSGVEIRHVVCDNPPCVRDVHLAPGTHADNMADMAEHGRAATGDRHGMRLYPERRWAKITAEIVIEIRRRYDAGERNGAALGREYGLGKSQVSRIIRRHCWAHL